MVKAVMLYKGMGDCQEREVSYDADLDERRGVVVDLLCRSEAGEDHSWWRVAGI